jgi:hypothetical protein
MLVIGQVVCLASGCAREGSLADIALGSGHSVARWSASQLEQGYAFLVAEGGVVVVGVAARTSCVPV